VVITEAICHYTPQVGMWTYKVVNSSPSSRGQVVQVVTLSSQSQTHTDPLTVRHEAKLVHEGTRLLRLTCDVTQGVHPVIGLNVTALIEMPDAVVYTVQLLDTGAGNASAHVYFQCSFLRFMYNW